MSWRDIVKISNEEAISDAWRFAPEDSSKRATRQEIGEHKLNQLVKERKERIKVLRKKLAKMAKGVRAWRSGDSYNSRRPAKGIEPIDTKALEELLDDAEENIRHKHYDYFYDKFMDLFNEVLEPRRKEIREERRRRSGY